MEHKNKLRKQLNEICKPYCTSDWCILKEMLLYSRDDLRTYTQVKMIEMLKWNISQRQHCEISWSDASIKWVESGMAKSFAEHYNENEIDTLNINELYTKIEQECNPFSTK